MLGRHAVHYRTGEPMPAALLERLLAARTFSQGFATVEYTASAIVDLDLHLLEDPDGLEVTAAEAATLERIGMPAEIVLRHRTPHFAHVFSGGGYASGYYSYLWSEMLDADAFAAFLEAGDAFDPGDSQAAARPRLRRRQPARPGRGVRGVPRPPAVARPAAAPARARPVGRGGVTDRPARGPLRLRSRQPTLVL